MNPESIPHPGKMGPALPLAVTGLAVFQAIPSLTEAWRVDLYARGALPAFGIWLAAQAWLFFRQRAASGGPNVVWLAVALGLAGAGSMTGLRVLHHLSLTAAVPALGFH